MRKLNNLALIFLIGLFAYGCATIVSGSKQWMKIESTPSNAKVSINGQSVGTTPLSEKIKRKKDNVEITIKLEGYETYTTTLNREFNAWYLGNIVFGGLIGLIIDPVTGAIYKLSPDKIDANLEKKKEKTEEIGGRDSNRIFIKLVKKNEKPGENWDKVGEMEREVKE
jgi:hypothetical protein